MMVMMLPKATSTVQCKIKQLPGMCCAQVSMSMLSFWLYMIFDPKCTGLKKHVGGLIKVNRLYKCVPSISWGVGRWLQPKWIIHLSRGCFMDEECNPSLEPSSDDIIFMTWFFTSTQMCPLYSTQAWRLTVMDSTTPYQWSHAISHIHHYLQAETCPCHVQSNCPLQISVWCEGYRSTGFSW